MSLALPVVQSVELAQHHQSHYMEDSEHVQTKMPSSPLKRPLPDDGVPEQERPSVIANRAASPAASTISSSLTSLSGTPVPANPNAPPGTAQPPAKRRKLTPAEKEAREREKAEKRAKREEEKARREEEKEKKDEERRQKNEVLEEKRREKELKKQEKEQAKKAEEEAKAKKEQAQSRINLFFAKPKASPKVDRGPQLSPAPAATPDAYTTEADQTTTAPASPSKPSRVISDYAKTFLPFAAPSNSVVARPNYFTWDEECTQKALQDADTWFTEERGAVKAQDLSACLNLDPYEVPQRGWVSTPVSDLVAHIDGSATSPSDLTGNTTSAPSDARARLKEHPVKYLFFREDVRPPYVGTKSNIKTRTEALRIARRPVKKEREEVDYDYDSEAEWEEPEEGEELGSEGEDEDDSVADAEELEEFLDDAEATDIQRPKKRFMIGDMEPVSTGLCWENEACQLDRPSATPAIDPRDYRMEILSDTFDFPIDPFSTAYWPVEAKGTEARLNASSDADRQPLHPKANIHINGVPSPAAAAAENAKPSKPQKPPKQVRLLQGQELEEFKQAVQGSDLTKQGLLAVVKKKLPKVPNAVLSDTLSTVAARVGAKEVDKRWVIVQQP